MLPLGSKLGAGRYELLRCIGMGGVGAVYEALDQHTQRHRAVKILQAGQLAQPAQRERFLREATVAAGIRSEHLVEVVDAGIDAEADVPFLVMELLHGSDLAALLSKQGGLSPEETIVLLGQAAMALDHLHVRDIVHRDVKPENLFITERDDGSPCLKLLDLGIAKEVALTGSRSHTDTGGTPLYMAPEQIRSEGAIDRRTDLYALGLTAYTMLVGRCYWHEDANQGIFALTQTLEKGPVEPASVRAARAGVTLPAAFDTWFAKATAHDREVRFDSALELVVRLAEALEAPVPSGLRSRLSLVAGLTLPSLGERSLTPPRSSEPAAVLEKKPSSARWLGWAGAVIGLAAAGWGIWSFQHGPASTQASQAPAARSFGPSEGVVACPVLETEGVADPGGWFGAAAATLACNRVTWMLGGRWERRLLPADLLGLASQPLEGFPDDPYAGNARERTLSAARERADAVLDGKATRNAQGYVVHLRLTVGQREAGTAQGRAPLLFDATAQAVEGLVENGAMPRAHELDPQVARMLGTSSVKAGLVIDTWTNRTDPEDPLASSCSVLRDELGEAAELGKVMTLVCAKRLGWNHVKSVELDRKTPFSLGYTAVMKLLVEDGWDPTPVAVELAERRRAEADPQARAWLADTEIAIWEIARRPERSIRVAREMVAEFPHVASFRNATRMHAETPSLRRDGARALVGWAPQDARNGWSQAWVHEDPSTRLTWSRRAFEIDSGNATYALTLAHELFTAGRGAEVPSVAARFESNASHADLVAYLGARVEAAAGRPSAGLDHMMQVMKEAPAAGRHAKDYHLMLTALHVAEAIGRGREFADFYADRFVLAEPTRLASPPPFRHQAGLMGLCMRSSRAAACLERVKTHFSPRWTPDDETLLQGALYYVRKDDRQAVAAWRGLLSKSAAQLDFIPVEAFDRAGEPDLASRLDAHRIADRGYAIRGVTLAHVREARRALRRGDRARARELAAQVVEAWDVLDVRLASVAEMRRIARGLH